LTKPTDKNETKTKMQDKGTEMFKKEEEND